MAGFYGCLRGKKDCSVMATGPPDVMTRKEATDIAEECPGKKRSKFQTFKNFFVKKKRRESPTLAGEISLKSSQSSDNISNPEPTLIHSEKDQGSGSKINMGNKALSHDSVFVSDSTATEVNLGLGTSHESVHGKVKSLQLQLKQAIRLGSPPSLSCVKKADDAGALSEDDGLPCSPPEYATLHTVLAGSSHRTSNVVQRTSSLSLEGTDSDDGQMSYEASSRPVSPLVLQYVDFSQPANPNACLDSAAARHRIAVRHQACAKRKPASKETFEGRRAQGFDEGDLSVDTEDKDNQDARFEQTAAASEKLKEETDGAASCKSERQGSVPDKEDEQSFGQEVFYSECASSPSVQNDSDSEEFFPANDHVPLLPRQATPRSGSLESLEASGGDFILDSGCDVTADSGSLLQEVLDSLKSPMTSVLVLKPDTEVRDVDPERGDNEGALEDRAYKPEPLYHFPKAPLPDKECLSSDNRTCLEDLQDKMDDEAEEEVEVECRDAEGLEAEDGSAEGLEAEDGSAEGLEAEDESAEDRESGDGCAEEEVTVDDDVGDEKPIDQNAEGEEVATPCEHLTQEEQPSPSPITEDYKQDENKEREGEEKKDDVEDGKEWAEEVEEEEAQFGPECLMQTEEAVEAGKHSAEVFESVSDDDTGSDSNRESPECPIELFEQPRVDDASSAPLPRRSSSVEATDRSEDLTRPNDELVESSKWPDPCSAPFQEQPSLQEACRVSSVPGDGEGLPCSAEQSQAKFTIAPAWQRSLSGGAIKEPSSAVTGPGTPEEGPTGKRELPCWVEPSGPAKPGSPAFAGRSQSASSLLSPRELPAHERESPENLFGVRLRKTTVLLRYGTDSPGESPGAGIPADAPEPERSYTAETPIKPALPKKPDLLGDIPCKPKRTPELAGVRAPDENLDSPSWISVARQKQKIFKDNSLDETLEKKIPAEEEPNRKLSLPSITTSINKDQSKLPGLPVKVPCSLEISKPTAAEKEGKRPSPPPAPLAQDEPPWLALAKKKAKAWSEMPQIVQ